MTTSLDPVQNACLPLIERELDRFFDDMAHQGLLWSTQMSRYHFQTGGKRLRALIPCWVFAAVEAPPEKAVPLGCALELVHNATLVHDDLQDRDTVRRGQPTVWKKYTEAQAINCGDALFQFATLMLMRMDLPAERFQRISHRLVRGTLQVIEGQAQEFLMKAESSPGLPRYLDVVRGKTAALMATAVVSAMEALGLSPQACEAAERLALKSGILFQIQDDLLDIYGDKQRERPASDIAEGKISALVACLNERASTTERQEVADVLAAPREETTNAATASVLALFEKYQVREALLTYLGELRAEIAAGSGMDAAPGIHRLLCELTARFLKPIQHLL